MLLANLSGAFTFLGQALLLIILGIIAAISYSEAHYLLNDYERLVLYGTAITPEC